jgi:hypothetical protein
MDKGASEEAGLHHHHNHFNASRGALVGLGGFGLVSRRFRSICYGRIYGA